MKPNQYAPGYDLFKAGVAAALLITIVILYLKFGGTYGVVDSSPQLLVTLATGEALSLTASAQPTSSMLGPATASTPVTSLPVTDSTAEECQTSVPSRLHVGYQVLTLVNLNMRQLSGLGQLILTTNRAGTQLEIIGGPVCTPLEGSAYLWWNVEREDGQQGWSAEASLHGRHYFLLPLP